MGIIAGFLSQTVLKFLLKFGEVSPFLGYNAFSDFFPKYPLTPNPECTDKTCQELQKYYQEHPEEKRLKDKEEEETKDDGNTGVSQENEWGITIEGGEDEQIVQKEEKKFVEVKKEQSLAELMNSMKKLQTKQ